MSAPTQVVCSWRAALRTAVQWLIAAALLWPALIAAIGDVPGWLAPILAAGSVVAAAITRIMAVPQVNLWLAAVGLSAKPMAATDRDVQAVTDANAAEPTARHRAAEEDTDGASR